MPRGAVASPAATAASPEAAPKVWTRQALDAAAKLLVERRALAHEAAHYAFDNSCGAKAACNKICDDPKKLTYNMVQPLLNQLKETGQINDDDRDHAKQILTNTERRKLAE